MAYARLKRKLVAFSGFFYARVWACLCCAQEQIKQPEATGSNNNDWASHHIQCIIASLAAHRISLDLVGFKKSLGYRTEQMLLGSTPEMLVT